MTPWLDVRSMRRRFARAASDRDRYDQASWLHREIATRMAERLQYIKLKPATVVDAGAGSGHALPMLAGHFPDARIVAIDSVAQQLERLASRSPSQWLRLWIGKSRAHPVVADFGRLPLGDASVECIWSNLALQWAVDPPAVFAEWHRVLATEGLLLFATLGPDTLKELRSAWNAADASLLRLRREPAPPPTTRTGRPRLGSRVHPFIDMHDIGDMLVHAGFSDPVMDMETITLTYRDIDALFSELRAAGAAGSHAERTRGLTGKARWRAMRDAYESLRRDGTLPATFEVVYGHAWKPPARAKADRDGVARVRIEDIGGLLRRPPRG